MTAFHIKPLLTVMLLLLAGSVNAIVMRHDTGYTAYVASETDYPAVFFLEQRRHRKVCVATLINPRWAVTAAHCLYDTPLLEQLQSDQTYPVEIAGQQVHVDAAWVHPHYPEAPYDFLPDVDLAVLGLNRALAFPRPVPLYRDIDELGQVVTFLGWGFHALGSGGPYRDDGRFRFANNTVAEAGYRLHFVFDDPRDRESAALKFEGLPGQGDSGGPALLEREDGVYLAGVAVGELSTMEAQRQRLRQGRYGAEVVYERITRHQRWLDAVMAGELKPLAAVGQNTDNSDTIEAIFDHKQTNHEVTYEH